MFTRFWREECEPNGNVDSQEERSELSPEDADSQINNQPAREYDELSVEATLHELTEQLHAR